jgi:hypothetical protein
MSAGAKESTTLIIDDDPKNLDIVFSDQDNDTHGKETGINGFIKKPYATNSLNKTVRRVLAGK